MTFDEYQKATDRTARYPGVGGGGIEAISYVTLGLAGEAGEVAEKVKKVLRDRGGVVSEELRSSLLKELGDVTWYISRLCTELGLSMSDVAGFNLEKLDDRAARGVLGGSGDDR